MLLKVFVGVEGNRELKGRNMYKDYEARKNIRNHSHVPGR